MSTSDFIQSPAVLQKLIECMTIVPVYWNENSLEPHMQPMNYPVPVYKGNEDYSNLLVKMWVLHGIFNDRLKDEILIKNLLKDAISSESFNDDMSQEDQETKAKRIRRKKNEIASFYIVSFVNLIKIV